MRNIIFPLLVLFAGTSLFAQKFEIGVNGGIGFNTAPAMSPTESDGLRPSDISLAASVKALYIRNNWQYGISVEYAELSYKANYYPPVFLPQYPAQYVPPIDATIYIAKPAIPFKLFVNRQLIIRRLETYAGLSAGYVLATNSQSIWDYETRTSYSGGGWTAGLQIGGTYFISKHFGINAEAQGNYMSLDFKSLHYSLWQFPFTLGIRYKL